jgi:hypothetical protein
LVVLVLVLALVGNLLSRWRGKASERSTLPLTASSSGKGKGKDEKRKGKREKGEGSSPFSRVIWSGEDRAGKPGQFFPPSAGISSLCLTLILAEIAARKRREGREGKGRESG